MSWQDDIMIEQEVWEDLAWMGDAEWKEMYGDELEKAARLTCGEDS